MNAPFTGQLFANCGNPPKFLLPKRLEYISAMSGEDPHQPFVDVVPHNSLRGLLAAIHAVVLPEPIAFHAIAVADGFVFCRCYIAEPGGFINKTGSIEPLDVLRIVEADIGMR